MNGLKKTWFYEAEEGDVIFFPCHMIHRGCMQRAEEDKTIISWNLDFQTIRQDVLYLNAAHSNVSK